MSYNRVCINFEGNPKWGSVASDLYAIKSGIVHGLVNGMTGGMLGGGAVKPIGHHRGKLGLRHQHGNL